LCQKLIKKEQKIDQKRGQKFGEKRRRKNDQKRGQKPIVLEGGQKTSKKGHFRFYSILSKKEAKIILHATITIY
jgi:hypothetical protein